MTTEEFIITLFCEVDERMLDVPKHPQAKLYPSEVVTIGLLFALKGGSFRGFYHWLARDYATLFGGLPERTRLHRLLLRHRPWCQRFLACADAWLVLDSYAIELTHPVRYRSNRAGVGYKLRDKGGRWLVGVRSAWLVNSTGGIVHCGWQPVRERGDAAFFVLLDDVPPTCQVLTDRGFRRAGGVPSNVQVCQRGEHNERMIVETVLSLLTRVCDLKHLWHRTRAALTMHLSYVAAMFNTLIRIRQAQSPSKRLSLADFAL
jgi:hypothetical protein